jgi:hypothetical protein
MLPQELGCATGRTMIVESMTATSVRSFDPAVNTSA